MRVLLVALLLISVPVTCFGKDKPMLSIFKKRIQSETRMKDNKELMEIRLSNELQRRMGLAYEDLQQAEFQEMTFDVGDFTLIPGTRLLNRNWVTVLQVTPKGTAPNFGYANTSDPDVDETWHYNMKGTCTSIYPPVNKINELFEALKQMEEAKQ